MVWIRVLTLKQWCLYTMKNVLGIGNVVFLGFGPNVLWGVFGPLNFGLLLPFQILVILYELVFGIPGFQGCLFFCIHNMPLCLALLLLYPEFCCYLNVSFYSELIQPPCILSPSLCNCQVQKVSLLCYFLCHSLVSSISFFSSCLVLDFFQHCLVTLVIPLPLIASCVY